MLSRVSNRPCSIICRKDPAQAKAALATASRGTDPGAGFNGETIGHLVGTNETRTLAGNPAVYEGRRLRRTGYDIAGAPMAKSPALTYATHTMGPEATPTPGVQQGNTFTH